MGLSGDAEAGALWGFATAFYSRPGIEPLLLALQDEDGLDIPLLIALLHAGRQGLALDGETLDALLALARSWQTQAISPLRQARRALRRPAPDPAEESLRARIKAAELEAEHLLLNRLEARLPRRGQATPREAILVNLDAYIASLAQPPSEAARGRLAALIREAAF